MYRMESEGREGGNTRDANGRDRGIDGGKRPSGAEEMLEGKEGKGV